MAAMGNRIDADEVMDLREASAYLRLRPRTLTGLAARGVVPGTKIGKAWRFRRSLLQGLFQPGSSPE